MNYDLFINQSLARIIASQRQDGSFTTYSSPDLYDFNDSLARHTLFQNALILDCLHDIDSQSPEFIATRNKLVAYIVGQRSELWSFNYWDRDATESRELPYPDDLDDTACALAALYRYDPSLFTGDVLAKIVSVLTIVETKESGPYKTWVASNGQPGEWDDVDVAVNANVAYFLSLLEVEVSGLNEYLDNAIKNNNYLSPYYPSSYPVLYYLSRAQVGKSSQLLVNTCLKIKELDSHASPLSQALILNAILSLNPELVDESDIQKLLNQAHANLWSAQGFCLDPALNHITYYAGSDTLTTAFCLQAIARFQAYKKSQSMDLPLDTIQITQDIKSEFQVFFDSLPSDMQIEITPYSEKILITDKSQPILLLPYYFARSLRNVTFKSELVTTLGLASLYGWLAYTIYDDITDKQKETRALPIANLLLQQLLQHLYRLTLPQQFYSLLTDTLSKMEKATYWEMQNCRVDTQTAFSTSKQSLPLYKDLNTLADRSLGHSITCLALLFDNKDIYTPKNIQLTTDMFRNYLIARQLDDDAHDWKEDLTEGRLNPVNVAILNEYFKSGPDFIVLTDKTLLELETIFWDSVLVQYTDIILNYCKTAREQAKELNSILNADFIDRLLTPIETSANKAKSEHKRTQDFLANL